MDAREVTLEAFTKKFSFKPEYTLRIGVEREYFLLDRKGHTVPKAMCAIEFMKKTGWRRRWGRFEKPVTITPEGMLDPELSLCQIETKSRPVEIEHLQSEVVWQDQQLRRSLRKMGLRALATEYWGHAIPDGVPDIPRYQDMKEKAGSGAFGYRDPYGGHPFSCGHAG